jgi:hypothetical protein
MFDSRTSSPYTYFTYASGRTLAWQAAAWSQSSGQVRFDDLNWLWGDTTNGQFFYTLLWPHVTSGGGFSWELYISGYRYLNSLLLSYGAVKAKLKSLNPVGSYSFLSSSANNPYMTLVAGNYSVS